MVKSGLAQMSKGGLIMDVVNADQARIAEEAGVSFKLFVTLIVLFKGKESEIKYLFEFEYFVLLFGKTLEKYLNLNLIIFYLWDLTVWPKLNIISPGVRSDGPGARPRRHPPRRGSIKDV